jgi:hypothetical protein
MASMPPEPDLPARFEPLRPASRGKRRLALLIGPAAWAVAVAVLAFVIDRRDAVELALALLAASFAVGLVSSSWMRRARLREERDG